MINAEYPARSGIRGAACLGWGARHSLWTLGVHRGMPMGVICRWRRFHDARACAPLGRKSGPPPAAVNAPPTPIPSGAPFRVHLFNGGRS